MSVLAEIFQRCGGAGEFLDFVEYYQSILGNRFGSVDAQDSDDPIYFEVLVEEPRDVFLFEIEVCHIVIAASAEFFHEICFAALAGPTDDQRLPFRIGPPSDKVGHQGAFHAHYYQL